MSCGPAASTTIWRMWALPIDIILFSRCWGIFRSATTSRKTPLPTRGSWSLQRSGSGSTKDKLYVTVFNGEGGVPRDIEAYDLWAVQGVPKDRIFEMGLKDNFWQMGDTGPCGPCSEIFYDMGPAASDHGHADCAFPCDCGRYVEIWNLVFMQFDRDVSGKLNPLPKPSIDTGMGLERVAAVLQGVISNYETDLFMPLIERASRIDRNDTFPKNRRAQRSFNSPADDAAERSLRVIADHSRAATFLISDGVLPSNEGRGYVLRKIIRRAITHGRLLGQTNRSSTRDGLRCSKSDGGRLSGTTGDGGPRLEGSGRRGEPICAHRGLGLEELERIVKEPATRAKVILVEELIADRPEHKMELEHAFSSARREVNDQIFLQAAAVFAPGERYQKLLQRWANADHMRVPVLPGTDAFKLYDTLDCRSTSCRTPHETRASTLIRRASIDRDAGFNVLLRVPPGKAQPSKPPTPPTSSFRNQSSKAIIRLVPTAARF